MTYPPRIITDENNALLHSCSDTRLYVLTDVTVNVRLFKDGRLGGLRESKSDITGDALRTVSRGDDVVCGGCGWIGLVP